MKRTMLFWLILLVISALNYESRGRTIIEEAIKLHKRGNLYYDGFYLTLRLNLFVEITGEVKTSDEDGRFTIKLRDGYAIGENSFIRLKGKKYNISKYYVKRTAFIKRKGKKYRKQDSTFYEEFVEIFIEDIGFSSPPFQFEMELLIENPQGKLKKIKRKISVKNGPERKKGDPNSVRDIILNEI